MKKIEKSGFKNQNELPDIIKREILKDTLIRRINKSIKER